MSRNLITKRIYQQQATWQRWGDEVERILTEAHRRMDTLGYRRAGV